MNDGKPNMDDWRKEVRQRLAALHDSLASPNRDSEIPAYVLETLAANTHETLLTTLDAELVRSLVVGAFRMIGDAGTINDDDPIVCQLLDINGILSLEERITRAV